MKQKFNLRSYIEVTVFWCVKCEAMMEESSSKSRGGKPTNSL